MTESIKLAVPLTDVTVDSEKRVIRGFAYTSNEIFEYEGKKFKFADKAVRPWRDHMPVMIEHDDTRLVGKMLSAEWDEDAKGWAVALSIAKTKLGDDTLALADAGAYGGLSPYIEKLDITEVDGVGIINSASAREISLAIHPVLTSAALTGVTLSATNGAEVGRMVAEALAKVKLSTSHAHSDDCGCLSDSDAEDSDELDEDELEIINAISLSAMDSGSNPESESEVENDTPKVEEVALASTQPTIVPVPLVGAERDVPYPHLLKLSTKPDHSIFADMKASKEGDSQARSRLNQMSDIMKLAVSTESYPESDPAQTPGLWQNTYDDPEQLLGWVRRGPALLNDNPYYAMRWYDASTEEGPGGEDNWFQDHVEGVEPGLSEIGTFGRELVTPGKGSSKIALTREAVENDMTPDAEALVMRRADVHYRRYIETKIMTYLDGLSDVEEVELAAAGSSTRGTLDALHNLAVDMAYSVEGNIFDRLLVSKALYNAITGAVDDTGRKLVNVSGSAVNSDGTANPRRATFTVDGLTGTPFTSPAGNSYLITSDALELRLGPQREFRFDYEIAWVRFGWWARHGVHSTDRRSIRRITLAA